MLKWCPLNGAGLGEQKLSISPASNILYKHSTVENWWKLNSEKKNNIGWFFDKNKCMMEMFILIFMGRGNITCAFSTTETFRKIVFFSSVMKIFFLPWRKTWKKCMRRKLEGGKILNFRVFWSTYIIFSSLIKHERLRVHIKNANIKKPLFRLFFIYKKRASVLHPLKFFKTAALEV